MPNALTTVNHTIISDAVLQAFVAGVAPLRAFCLNASPGAISDRGNKVKVLSVPAQDAAIDFVAADGYVMQDADAEGVDVTISRHKFVSWALSDTEIANSPIIELESFGQQKGHQLARAVFQDILSLVTAANYGTAGFVGAASTFDSDDVVDIGKVCDDADWPGAGRSLILASAYHAALRKDNAIQDASAFGTDDSIRRGVVPSLDTFESIYKSTILPANAEALVGLAVLPQAILIANRYLQPQEGHKYSRAEPVSDESGLTLGLREWYNEDLGSCRIVMECNYGYVRGLAAAIKRITSA